MILHADLNSFFARVEQQANPGLRNRPIGILGKGHKGARTCICAASPEAKKFGVKSGASTWEARRLCPSIILVPPDYPKYLDISRRFMGILEDFSPNVEIFSIDEAFVDLKSQAPNPKSQTNSKNPNPEIQNIIDSQNLNFENCLKIDNWKLEIQEAVGVSLEIKKRMKQELGELITCSIGVAWGKVFAKLAGELHKPDGLVILTPNTWRERVGDIEVDKFCGVGDRLSAHLEAMGIRTINELAGADAGLLIARFGRSTGMRLYNLGQGHDASPVASSRDLAPAKSIGHQITLDNDYLLASLSPIVTKLTKKVGRRLRRARLAAGMVQIQIALGNYGGYLHRHRRREPAVMTDYDLIETAHQLLADLPLAPRTAVRRIGIVASNLMPDLQRVLPLFPVHARHQQLSAPLDALRDQYGEEIIEWAGSFGTQMGNLRDWRGPRAVLDL